MATKRIILNLGIIGLSLFVLTILLTNLNQAKTDFQESIQINWSNIKVASDENIELIRELSISGIISLEITEKLKTNQQIITTNLDHLDSNKHLKDTLLNDRSPLSQKNHDLSIAIDNNLFNDKTYRDNYTLIRTLEDYYMLLSEKSDVLINPNDYNRWVIELKNILKSNV